jgi:hypothetical protein
VLFRQGLKLSCRLQVATPAQHISRWMIKVATAYRGCMSEILAYALRPWRCSMSTFGPLHCWRIVC